MVVSEQSVAWKSASLEQLCWLRSSNHRDCETCLESDADNTRDPPDPRPDS